MLLTILLLRKETKGPVPSYGPAIPHQLVETSVNSLLPETSFDVDFRAGYISLCSGESPQDFSVLLRNCKILSVLGGKTAFARPCK